MTSNGLPRIGIVTGDGAPRLTGDGRAVLSGLRERGYVTTPVVWRDPSVDSSPFDAVVVRSCWDYHTDPDAFREWLDTCEAEGVLVINSPDVIRWNLHKHYLGDLEDAGVRVVPTVYADAESDLELATIASRHEWSTVVVKPAIGTSSEGVWRTSTPIEPAAEDRFHDERLERGLLVQEFVPEITDGERSLVFVEGTFSHATRSVPAVTDFRAHHDLGGTSAPDDPSAALVGQSRAVLDAAAEVCSVDPSTFVYARVDGVVREGTFVLFELELIEPYLSLSTIDGGVDRFVDALDGALRRRSEAIADALS